MSVVGGIAVLVHAAIPCHTTYRNRRLAVLLPGLIVATHPGEMVGRPSAGSCRVRLRVLSRVTSPAPATGAHSGGVRTRPRSPHQRKSVAALVPGQLPALAPHFKRDPKAVCCRSDQQGAFLPIPRQ